MKSQWTIQKKTTVWVVSAVLVLSIPYGALMIHSAEVKEQLTTLQTEQSRLVQEYRGLEDELKVTKEKAQVAAASLQQTAKENEALRKEVEQLRNEKATLQRKASVSPQAELTSRGTTRQRWMTVKATGYIARCKGCSGFTATGVDVRNTSVDHRVIAVDPNVIPLNSIVEVEGKGQYRAIDTGGAIKGNKIDILFQTEAEAIQFGRKDVKVRIIRARKG